MEIAAKTACRRKPAPSACGRGPNVAMKQEEVEAKAKRLSIACQPGPLGEAWEHVKRRVAAMPPVASSKRGRPPDKCERILRRNTLIKIELLEIGEPD